MRIVFETTPEIRRKLRLIMAMRDLDSMKQALEQLINAAPEVAGQASEKADRPN